MLLCTEFIDSSSVTLRQPAPESGHQTIERASQSSCGCVYPSETGVGSNSAAQCTHWQRHLLPAKEVWQPGVQAWRSPSAFKSRELRLSLSALRDSKSLFEASCCRCSSGLPETEASEQCGPGPSRQRESLWLAERPGGALA